MNYLDKIKHFFYDRQKKKVMKELSSPGFQDYYYAFNFNELKSSLREDMDILRRIINKTDNSFLNNYTDKEKQKPFFKQLLKEVKKDHNFVKINIPHGKDFEQFHVLQKLLKNEEVDFVSLDSELKKDPNIYALCLNKNSKLLYYFIDDFLDSIVVAEEVMVLSAEKFKDFSEKVRADENVCIMALVHDENQFKHVSEDLKNSETFLLNTLKYQGKIFPLIKNDIRLNKSFREKAVEVNKLLLEYVEEKARDDNYMLEQVKQKPHLLRFASDELKNDFHLAKLALKDNVNIFRSLSKKLRNNKELALLAVSLKAENLEHCSDKLKDDVDVVREALLKSVHAYGYSSTRLKKNKDLIFSICKQGKVNSGLFIYMDRELFHDKDIVNLVLNTSASYIELIPPSLRKDIEIRDKILKYAPDNVSEYESVILGKIKDIDKSKNKEVITFLEEMIGVNPLTIKFFSEDLKDKEFYFKNADVIEINKNELVRDYEQLQMYLRERNLNKLFESKSQNEVKREKKKI